MSNPQWPSKGEHSKCISSAIYRALLYRYNLSFNTNHLVIFCSILYLGPPRSVPSNRDVKQLPSCTPHTSSLPSGANGNRRLVPRLMATKEEQSRPISTRAWSILMFNTVTNANLSEVVLVNPLDHCLGATPCHKIKYHVNGRIHHHVTSWYMVEWNGLPKKFKLVEYPCG